MKVTIPMLVLGSLIGAVNAQETIEISSPGLPSSRMNSQGVLVEDWGTLDIQLTGEGLQSGETDVASIKLDDLVPAARAVTDCGAIRVTRTVFRAPVYPAGVDVLTVNLAAREGSAADLRLKLQPSVGLQLGERTARVGGRVVMVLPQDVVDNQELLDWGFCDEASSLTGWAKPQGACDAAFRNIRAGMGGVPIVYRFAVAPSSELEVVLGLCESHWAERGRRPLRCRVEGAESQTIDPVAKWGQHKPGLLTFKGKDENGDGRLDVTVRSARDASDRNPILNVIWIYPAGHLPRLEQVLAGTENDTALYYVDVGGKQDQSIYPASELEFPVHIDGGGNVEMTFLIACPGSSAPSPSTTAWTLGTLRRAARDVSRDW